METPNFAFSTWGHAARRLNEAARDARVSLHPLPYRRFDPEADATWWLAPTPDNPAYANGKIVVEGPSPQSPGGPLVGLHIEKGVGPAAAEFFAGKGRAGRLVMDNGWIWHAFSREMKGGRVDLELARAVAAAEDSPVLVSVVSEVQSLPGLEQGDQRPRGAPEHIWFRPSDGRLVLAGENNAGDVARRIREAETMAGLIAKISSVPNLDFRWLEVMVGIPFRRVDAGGLEPAEIWRRACQPWTGWLSSLRPGTSRPP